MVVDVAVDVEDDFDVLVQVVINVKKLENQEVHVDVLV